MKKYKLLTMLILFGFILSSCSLDDNIDPNNPQSDQLSARMRLASAEVSSYVPLASSMNGLGNVFMNAYSGNIYWFGNPLTKECNLAIDNSFYQRIWNNTYPAVSNLQTIIDGDTLLVYHRAIALILKVHYMQYIVDLYNDVPYSEAFQRVNNVAPKYDKSIDIYKSFIAELDTAVALINDNPENPDIVVNPTEDVIMGGDMDRWLRFANTVKLRVLMRMSETTNAEAIALRDAGLASLAGAQFVDFDVTIQPGYSAASAANQNPIYNAFGRRLYDGTTNTYGWRLYLASDHVAKALNGTSTITSGVLDPRRAALFRLKADTVSGVIQGDQKNAAYTESRFSLFGGWLYTPADEGSAHDGYIMTRAESEFLQSEAAVEYPAIFSDAQTHFTNGIQASFDMYGLTADAAAYITAIDAKDNAGWTASANKIAAIQYQRWIALIHINGIETYLSYLKTGYPVTPLALTAQKLRKPYRLVYPQTEYTSNATNVPLMTGDDCFVINDFTPFWLK